MTSAITLWSEQCCVSQWLVNLNSWPRPKLSRLVLAKDWPNKWNDLAIITVVQTVLTATFNSYGTGKFQPPHKINTPEPIDKNIGRIDYIREGTSYTKFGRNPFTGGFWANVWNITKIIFIYLYLFSFISLQVRPMGGFLHAIAQKTWNHASICAFWGL